ncbi:hypothetical protein [Embleya sp. AB8]|uniref:hypothetical protein n=1 Tax=Embleya sp. AB8 TaxID=3156304 RepID=UPI003C795C11
MPEVAALVLVTVGALLDVCGDEEALGEDAAAQGAGVGPAEQVLLEVALFAAALEGGLDLERTVEGDGFVVEEGERVGGAQGQDVVEVKEFEEEVALEVAEVGEVLDVAVGFLVQEPADLVDRDIVSADGADGVHVFPGLALVVGAPQALGEGGVVEGGDDDAAEVGAFVAGEEDAVSGADLVGLADVGAVLAGCHSPQPGGAVGETGREFLSGRRVEDVVVVGEDDGGCDGVEVVAVDGRVGEAGGLEEDVHVVPPGGCRASVRERLRHEPAACFTEILLCVR